MLFHFADPYFLILILIIPFLTRLYIKRLGIGAAISFSHLGYIKDVNKTRSLYARHILFVLRMLALLFFIIAFARPQSGVTGEEIITEGIDIMLAIDVSSSMLAEDIKPNRLEAVKQVAADFIKARRNDRIGMVIFAREGFTQCPLTVDYGILLSLLDEIKIGMIDDGTALGMGLVTSINRLRDSEAKTKVVILLTDGVNNAGEIDPATAAHLASALDLKVYTIGAGKHGKAMYPMYHPLRGNYYDLIEVDIDETMLIRMADLTGGRYFRATNRDDLENIYQEIDALEKTKIQIKEYTRYSELFYVFLIAGLIFLLAETGLANTRFRKIP